MPPRNSIEEGPETFLVVTTVDVSNIVIWWVEMSENMLNTLQRTNPTTKNHPFSNTKSTKAKKPYILFSTVFISPFILDSTIHYITPANILNSFAHITVYRHSRENPNLVLEVDSPKRLSETPVG